MSLDKAPHEQGQPKVGVSRRNFLKRSSLAFSAAIAITPAGALLNTSEAWGLEVKGLKPETARTLILIARDIYPHDRVPDRFYAIAVRPWDTKAASDPATAAEIEGFIAGLDKAAGNGGYVGLGWEADRVALLREASSSNAFAMLRADLVTSLYNQPALWSIFGYEGESFSKGGYINRGFNDITWL